MLLFLLLLLFKIEIEIQHIHDNENNMSCFTRERNGVTENEWNAEKADWKMRNKKSETKSWLSHQMETKQWILTEA